MARINLTDKYIESDKRVPKSGRVDYQDALVPGLALRVSSTGNKSFVLVARYPTNPRNPTRRALGEYGAITLEEARVKAREWLALLNKHIDPKVEEARQRAAALRSQQNNFGYVAEEFLKRYVKGPAFCELERLAAELRKTTPDITPPVALRRVMADPANRALVAKSKKEGLVKKIPADTIIRAEFIKRWNARPITEILPQECAAAIRAIVDRGAPEQARTAFEWLRRIFSWAIGTNEFNITTSPVATLRPSDLIGQKESRDRVLTDDELRKVWNACDAMGHPYGPTIRMLILTGQRLREVSEAMWEEIDLEKNIWTISASRMKGDHGAHVVPLGPDAIAHLKSLPRFVGSDFVFTTDGKKAVNGFSKTKARLDTLSGVEGWVFHDLRRTMRSHLSALDIEDRVREHMIAHAQPGLHKVYDLHKYLDEKRRGFELWEQRLRGILAPKPPAEVADLSEARAARGAA
jgi:integrase